MSASSTFSITAADAATGTIDLSGLWIPLVTPFANGALDHAALATLTERMCNAGVAGFAACGSTGEAAALSHEEEDAVLATILRSARGKPGAAGAADGAAQSAKPAGAWACY